MTTDLTGDFELGEEEFEWDEFVPDADEAEIAAEAAALDDEDELDLDDSDFDWDAALRDDPEPRAGADGEARAGAAYDRIVDTVRRSFEDTDPETDGGHEMDAGPEPDTVAHGIAWTMTEDVAGAASGPGANHLAGTSAGAPETDAALPTEVRLAESELDEELDAESESRAESESKEESEIEFEFAQELAWTIGPEAAEASEPEPPSEPEPEPEPESVEARIAEMAATVASLAPVESFSVATPEAALDAVTEPATQWETADEAVGSVSPVPAPSRKSRTHPKHERNGRNKAFTATLVLACLVLVIAAAVLHARQHPTTSTTAGVVATHAPPASTTSEAARIQAATDALDSATTSASVGLASLPTFPTPSNVEKVVNPYMSSLQLYGSFLSASTVPAAARSAASSAEAQVHQDLQFLDTIDTLPPLQLGAYLKQFDADATQLQTTLSALEQDLRAPTA